MNKAGFYISGRAQAWLVNLPPGHDPSTFHVDEAELNVESMQEIVYKEKFLSGLTIKAARNGFIAMGFVGVSGFLSEEQVDKKRRPDEDWSLARLNARVPVGDAINAFLACLNGSLQSSSKICELEYVANNRLTDVTEDLTPLYTPNRRGARTRTAVIGGGDLRNASEAVERLLSHSDRNSIRLVALYNWAVGSLCELDYARSLITSWAIVEKLLEVIWLEFISKNSESSSAGVLKPPTSGNRANKLKGSNITASIKVEILSVAAHLSESEYTLIEKSRRVRNNWIHSLAPVTFYDAIDAAAAAAALIRRVYNVKVQTKYQVFGQWSS